MEIQEEWWEQEEAPDDPIAVEELDSICMDMRKQDTHIKEMEKRVDDQKTILSKMKNRCLTHLKELGKTKYRTESGTFYIQTAFSVKTPKTEEEKKAFFNWCTEKEIYWEYATVNSRSLQSLYKSMLKSDGEEFVMPGVQEPTSFEQLKMRAK